ncbi:MAG TPA: hypothetical protein VIT19_04045 [Pyrinomonadaceae bacterium]
MSLFKKLFGTGSPLKLRRKQLQEMAEGVSSEAFLIQELTTAKAAAIAGGLSEEDAARVLAKVFSYYYCLHRSLFIESFHHIPPPPLLKYVIVTTQASDVLAKAPGPYPDAVRSWVIEYWRDFFTAYGC